MADLHSSRGALGTAVLKGVPLVVADPAESAPRVRERLQGAGVTPPTAPAPEAPLGMSVGQADAAVEAEPIQAPAVQGSGTAGWASGEEEGSRSRVHSAAGPQFLWRETAVPAGDVSDAMPGVDQLAQFASSFSLGPTPLPLPLLSPRAAGVEAMWFARLEAIAWARPEQESDAAVVHALAPQFVPVLVVLTVAGTLLVYRMRRSAACPLLSPACTATAMQQQHLARRRDPTATVFAATLLSAPAMRRGASAAASSENGGEGALSQEAPSPLKPDRAPGTSVGEVSVASPAPCEDASVVPDVPVAPDVQRGAEGRGAARVQGGGPSACCTGFLPLWRMQPHPIACIDARPLRAAAQGREDRFRTAFCAGDAAASVAQCAGAPGHAPPDAVALSQARASVDSSVGRILAGRRDSRAAETEQPGATGGVRGSGGSGGSGEDKGIMGSAESGLTAVMGSGGSGASGGSGGSGDAESPTSSVSQGAADECVQAVRRVGTGSRRPAMACHVVRGGEAPRGLLPRVGRRESEALPSWACADSEGGRRSSHVLVAGPTSASALVLGADPKIAPPGDGTDGPGAGGDAAGEAVEAVLAFDEPEQAAGLLAALAGLPGREE